MSKVCAICGTGTPGSPGLSLSEDDELVARRIYEAAAEADGAWDEVEALRRQLAGVIGETIALLGVANGPKTQDPAKSDDWHTRRDAYLSTHRGQ